MARFDPTTLSTKVVISTKRRILSYLALKPKVKLKRKAHLTFKQVYRKFNSGFKALVVALRYGSVKYRNQIINTIPKIAKELNVSNSTISYLLRKFDQNKINYFKEPIRPGRPVRDFTQE